MKYIPVIPIVMLLILIPSVMNAEAANASSTGGDLSGIVVNGTRKDRPVSGLSVSLISMKEEKRRFVSESSTDGQGRFSFANVSPDNEASYLVSTIYGGVEYSRAVVGKEGDASTGIVLLKVYEKSGDPANLGIETYHLLIDPVEGGLRVSEIFLLKNSSAFTYSGGKDAALRFPLPEGAREIGLAIDLSGEEASVAPDSVTVTAPISPEGKEIAFRYDIPVSGKSFTLRKWLILPVASFHAFLSVPGSRVDAAGLTEQDPVMIENRQYFHLAGSDLGRDENLDILISHLPDRNASIVPIFGALGVLLLIIVAVLFPFIRSRRSPARDAAGSLRSERKRLILEIARLDESFAAGQMTEDEYRKIRGEKKDLLTAITRSSLRRDTVRSIAP